MEIATLIVSIVVLALMLYTAWAAYSAKPSNG